MTTTSDIDETLADILAYICKNPLIFVSETDIHALVMAELMKKIPALNKLYPTNSTIGLNKEGRPSKSKYMTMAIHKEYGHHDMPSARSDIVILNPQDINNINNPLNLKVNRRWIVPDYIFEFGTEKCAGTEQIFRDHLNNDMKKTVKSRERGYVIHIQRNLCVSKGKGLSENRSKYEGYSNVIRESVGRAGPNQRILVIIVGIGNEGRGIYKEGKVKIFRNGKFVGINKNSVKGGIERILK